MICEPVYEKKSVVSKRAADLYFSLGSVKKGKQCKFHIHFYYRKLRIVLCNIRNMINYMATFIE